MTPLINGGKILESWGRVQTQDACHEVTLSWLAPPCFDRIQNLLQILSKSIDVAGDGFQYRKEKATLPIGQLWLAYITRLRRLVWLIWFRCVCSLRWGRGKTRIVVRRSCTCRRWSESRIILRVESGLGIHHSIDSGDDEMKCFVDIFGVFDTHFDEVYVHLLRKFLALLIGDLSLVNQIDFIADKKHPLWRGATDLTLSYHFSIFWKLFNLVTS